MALKDLLHKFTRRWDSRHSKYIYNGTRGEFEIDENAPRGHSGKLTAIIDPAGVLAPAGIVLPNPTDVAYVTQAEICFLVAAPPAQIKVSLQDAAGNNLIQAQDQLNAEWNDEIGDGSGVIAQFTGLINSAITHGGISYAGGLIKIAYYLRSV